MTLKKLLLVMSALAGVTAFAQDTLGTVVNVQGVVTATQGTTGMTVAPGTVVVNGERFVTTTNGAVTLRMNSGCVVTVPAGHSVTVAQNMTCQQLADAVTPVTVTTTTTVVETPAGDSFIPSSTVVNGVIALGAVGILAGAASLGSGGSNAPLSGH